jgi:hypothetical protein
MLLQHEYNQLWHTEVEPILKSPSIHMPSYAAYVQREQFRQMYLQQLLPGQFIRYVLLGEAAPESGNFIYQDALGSYITAPLGAVGKVPRKKANRLSSYAQGGFVLLDLYPFALNYNHQVRGQSIREWLANSISYQQEIHQYLLHDIMHLPALAADWKYCLVGPLTTSLGFLSYLENKAGGYLMPGQPVSHFKDQLSAVDFADKSGRLYKEYTNSPDGHVTKRARITVGIGGSGPSPRLVRRALF